MRLVVCPLVLIAGLVLAGTVGCGSDEGSSAAAPVSIPIFDFTVTVRPDSAGLDLLGTEGRPLLEGIGAGTVGEDDIPLVGFAVRDITQSYEMQFGSFRPMDEPQGPWRVAQRADAAANGAGLSVRLLDDAGAVLARLEIWSPGEGHLEVDVERGDGPEKRLSWGFSCNDDDHFMGFGAQTWDVDHRGHTLISLVQEQGVGKVDHNEYTGLWMVQGRRWSSHIPIPQYLARRGYVATVESDLRATFAMCAEREDVARIEVEMPAKIHVFDGPSPAKALERSSARFGRPRMPPRVAFAPWNDAIYGSDNVRRVARKLREKGIPSSVIWSEDWKGAEQVGDAYRLSEEWQVDRTLYPDIEQLAQELHALGFKFFVYFNTFVYRDSSAWEETAPGGLLIENADGQPYTFTGAKMSDTSLLDLSDPQTRAWTKGKLKDAIALGADGWMGDFAEWMPTDAVTYAGSGLEQHNLHPVHWQQVQREAIDEANDGVERMFFGRSGWFGTPELADVIWAGDQRTSFQEDDGMPTVLPIGIGLGVVGISTYGHDIAGYQSTTNPPSTKELFFRWTELGAWSPVMRTHHGYQAQKNWSWESDEETTEHFARYARLHIALVPMWEGLAKVAHDTGLPIWRGLGMVFPEDASLWPIKDQVMIGDRLMIAPVMIEGATSRSVVLPAGRWFGWDGDDASVEGPTILEEGAGMAEIPVFARAGAVIPMYPDGVMTLTNASAEVPGPESVGDDRVVRAYLGDSGAFAEAGGLSYAVEQTGQQDASVVQYVWSGSPVTACDVTMTAPCVEQVGARRDRVHVVGPGNLMVEASGQPYATVRAEGGAADRRIVFDVRR